MGRGDEEDIAADVLHLYEMIKADSKVKSSLQVALSDILYLPFVLQDALTSCQGKLWLKTCLLRGFFIAFYVQFGKIEFLLSNEVPGPGPRPSVRSSPPSLPVAGLSADDLKLRALGRNVEVPHKLDGESCPSPGN